MNDDSALLARTPALRNLDEAILDAMLADTEVRHLDPGEILFRSGQDFLDLVFILRRGVLDLRHVNGATHRPEPGYFVGLSSFLADTPYASTAVAVEASEVLCLGGARLRALEREYPPLSDALNRLIVARLRKHRLATIQVSGPLVAPVSAAMSAPIATCPAATPLRDALRKMLDANLGSLAVVGEDGRLLGLLTYHSACAHWLAEFSDPATDTAGDACRPAGTESPSTPLWQVHERLQRDAVKHLIVTEDRRPIGLVAQTDIVRLLVSRQGSIAAAVESAPDVAALRSRYESIVEIAREALESNRLARTAVGVVSAAHLAIQRRCVELTLAEMAAQGHGEAPASYALLIMGSGGRHEMLLDPDQDNGIIIDKSATTDFGKVGAWFERFCACLNANLATSGYRLCPGDIMARHPRYRKSLRAWKAQVSKVMRAPNDKAARWSNIVFDFDTLYGDARLTSALRDHVHREIAENPRLLGLMVEDDAQGRAPLNFFNRLVTTGARDGVKTVDVKRNGLRIIADAARILGLREGVASANTAERIAGLVRRGVLSTDFAATIMAAYDTLLEILLRHQIEQRSHGTTPDKEVAPDELSPPEREALRISMRAVKRFQDRLRDEIQTSETF